ncbi:MAG: DinB family protein [Nitrolancea sp.]
MDNQLGDVIWRQFGAAIDMLDNALTACPDSLWTERIWSHPPSPWFPPPFAEFWYVAFHTIVWLDLYLSGAPEEDFVPPAPFLPGEVDSAETAPERPYAKDELRAYLAFARQKCHDMLVGLTDDQARQTVQYPWSRGQSIGYLELQLYNMRHVQEHAAQLSLFLGQHDVPNEEVDWVAVPIRDPDFH